MPLTQVPQGRWVAAARLAGKCGWMALMLALACAQAMAQSENDVLRFSESNVAGTARAQGMAGAMTAFGADFSALTLNPAGLGYFRRGHFVVSPSLQLARNQTSFIGESASDNLTNFGFANIGAVFSSPIYRSKEAGIVKTKGIKGFTIAVGFVQQNNYHRQVTASAYNPFNTIGDALVGAANGIPINPRPINRIFINDPYLNAAFRSFMIDTLPGTNAFYRPYAPDARVQQGYGRTERGRTNQWAVGAGFNVSERFFFGATFSLMDYYYRYQISYTERDVTGWYLSVPNGAGFRNFTYNDDIEISGFGVNARLGIMAQPWDFLRLGASIQTATITLGNSMRSRVTPEMYMFQWNGRANPGSAVDPTQPSGNNRYAPPDFQFGMITPLKFNIGAAYLLPNKWGVVTVDADFIDMRAARLDDSGGSFRDDNQRIRTNFQWGWGLRTGAEVKYKQFFGRGGFAVYGNPLSSLGQQYGDLRTYEGGSGRFNINTLNSLRRVVTMGLGFRANKFFIDAAYVLTISEDKFSIYNTPNFIVTRDQATGALFAQNFSAGTTQGGLGGGFGPVMVNSKTLQNIIVTVGILFNNQ
jgi:hypothetical protein